MERAIKIVPENDMDCYVATKNGKKISASAKYSYGQSLARKVSFIGLDVLEEIVGMLSTSCSINVTSFR